MTNGTIALLSRLHASTSTSQTKAKTTTSGPSTTRMRNAPRRRYEVHGERTCYQCRQTGHYARECPHAYNQQLTETKAETMKNLIRSMTLNERSEFKRFVTRAEKLRILIKTMTTTERSKFKAYVLRKEKQQKISTDALSRETSPHTNLAIAAVPPSRETGPRPNKSVKKLAQALKKRIRHETNTPKPSYPFEMFTETSKSSSQTSRSNPLMEKLANALKRSARQRRVRCDECGKEHPTRTCIRRSKRLREE